jgi:hypothetical protein
MPDPRNCEQLQDLVRERMRARAAKADTSPQAVARVAPSTGHEGRYGSRAERRSRSRQPWSRSSWPAAA